MTQKERISYAIIFGPHVCPTSSRDLLWSHHEGSLQLPGCQTTEKFSINLKCLRFPSTAFKWKNLYFCQQICCLLCCEYWIMVTQTTNSSSSSAKSGNWKETFALLIFWYKLNFPFRKTRNETSLGILRVKPEVFDFFSRFFIYIIQRNFPLFVIPTMIK